MVHLRLVFRVRRRQLSVDGRREAAVVLVVVGQLQVQQAGAGGQVDVLHVIHLRATHRAQLKGQRAQVSVGGGGKTWATKGAADRGSVYIPGFGKQGGSIFLRWWNSSMDRTKTRQGHMTGLFVLIWTLPLRGHGPVGLICCVLQFLHTHFCCYLCRDSR